jgi:dissimilatory sulfite reductase (desulfoviridin) alpha/beta subunit
MTERKTPLLDELEKGPWPSFVKEIKKSSKSPMVQDLLGQLERSYSEKIGHWKHGGLVGVKGYGGGVIGRYNDLPQEFPNVSEFHTVRVNQPSGWFYTSDALRTLCDIWDAHGSGLTNVHGSTGDLVFLGTKTTELEPIFSKLTEAAGISGAPAPTCARRAAASARPAASGPATIRSTSPTTSRSTSRTSCTVRPSRTSSRSRRRGARTTASPRSPGPTCP